MNAPRNPHQKRVQPVKNATIKQMWADYLQHAMPPNAQDHQISECKLVFFAGAKAMFHLLAIQAPEMSDDEACQYMDSLNKEMDEFAAEFIRTGKVP